MWNVNVSGQFANLASADSSYSFQYVYENDANSGNDAGSSFSTALGIQLGSYTGLLYGADTVDMYKFDASAGQNYYFNLVPPSTADFGISVYDPNWNFVVGSDLGTGRTNYGSFTATSTTSWFVKIYLTSGSGQYGFSISTTPLPNDFTIFANPSSWTYAAGTALCVNQAVGTTITIQTMGGFSGNVYLSGSLPPSSPTSPPSSPFYQPTYNPVVVPVGGPGSTSALIRGATTQPWGTVQRFFVTVTGTSGSLSHSTTLTVDVSSYCDMTPIGGSVPAGSKITMSDGTAVPVQDLQVGSKVIVYDVASGYQTTVTIKQILVISTNSLLTLHTSAGLPFRADANPRMKLHVLVNGQPILKPITEIQPGDQIYNWDLQSWVDVTSVSVAYGGTHTMYDLVTDPLLSTSGAVLEYIANGYPDCPQACKT
jgi:hypothetical protein